MKNKNKLEFISTMPSLFELKDLHPKPAASFIPQWWKDAPFDSDMDNYDKYHPKQTFVRRCPAFPDMFSSGYVIPMWADTTLYYNSKTGEWRWRCGSKHSPYKINFFGGPAFSDYGKYYYKGNKAKAVFQLESPWLMKAPKGMSLWQFPIFYNDSDDFAVLAGTVDADLTTQQKIEIGYFGDDKEIFIKQGTPIAQYIPYQKINHSMSVRNLEKHDEDHMNKFFLRTQSTFKNWYGVNRRRNKG